MFLKYFRKAVGILLNFENCLKVLKTIFLEFLKIFHRKFSVTIGRFSVKFYRNRFEIFLRQMLESFRKNDKLIKLIGNEVPMKYTIIRSNSYVRQPSNTLFVWAMYKNEDWKL